MEAIPNGEPASKIVFEVNCALLFHLVDATETNEFHVHFNISRLYMKQILKLFMFSKTFLAKKIADGMRGKASARSKPLKLAVLESSSDPNLQEMGTEQIRQVLRAFFAVVTYAKKKPRLPESFYTLFRAGQSSMALIIRCQFLQTILNSSRRVAVATLGIATLFVFEIRMFLYSVAIIGKAIKGKALKCSRPYSTVTLIGYTV